ncbi:MAG: hypothetical protein RMJ67_07585 [Elusimicrobiota bacterium]|nr:hypothetical protein [Endomicrobiia bacterium]MDW8166353.1 hypothetical protein [Elusimicrobiota bacterium]
MLPQLESSKEIILSSAKRIYMPQLVKSNLIDVSSYHYTQEAIFMAQNLRQVDKMRGVKTYFYVPLLEKAERMRLKESKLHAESLMQARMETFDADIYAPKLSNSDLLDLYATFLYAPNLNNVARLDAENHTRKQFIDYSPDRPLAMLYMPNLQKADVAHAGNTTLFAPNAEVNKLSHRDAIVYTKSFKVDEALRQHAFYDNYSNLDDFMNKNIQKIENIVDDYIKRKFNTMDNLAKELDVDPASETIELDINKRFLESLNKNPTPAYQRAISKMETAISDVHDRLAEIIRVPYWNKVLNPLVTTLMKITARAHTITYESRQYMKPYYELKDKTRVNQILLRGDEIGKTFKRYELEGAGLTEQEIQAYYGVRKAIDYIQKVGLKRFMIDAGFTEQEADNFIKAHYLEGYLPHVRRGRFGVWIGVPDEETGKKTLYYETFDTMAEAKTFAETILREGLPKDALTYARNKGIPVENPNIFILDTKTGDATHIFGEGVEKGMLIGFVYREPAMMSILHRYIPMLEQYLKARGVTDEDITKLTSIIDKEYLKVFAGGRLARRAGIAGYDIDVEAIIKEYITNAPLAFARRFYYVEVMEELGKIAKNNMEYYLYAKDLIDYFYGRKDYESMANIRLRTLIYLYHLAWKPAFLVVNMTQRFMTTIWKAHADAGMKGFEIFGKVSPLEFRLYTDALFKYRGDFLKAVDNAKYLSEEAKEVIHRLFLEGELEAVMHYDIGFKDKLTNALAIFGTLSERSNRINAALVATEIAKHKGLSGEALYEYTLKFIRDTQFPYSMANRPILGRGILAPFFVFKSYMFNYFNFLRSLYPNKKSFMGALLTALALCGAEGLPFLNQIVDLIMSILDDYDPTARFKLREITKNIPDFVRKGILVRIGVDGSITWGMSELFGVAAVPIAQEALLGISLAYQYSQGRDIDFAEVVKRMSPAMVKRIINANVIWQQGIPSDIFGKPYFTVNDLKKLPKALRIEALKIYNDMPREIPTHEKVLYTLGFTTPTLNTFYDNLSLIKEATENYKQLSAGYARDVAKALYKKDYDKATQLIQEAYSRGIYLQRQAIRHHLQEYLQSGQSYIRLKMEEEDEETE